MASGTRRGLIAVILTALLAVPGVASAATISGSPAVSHLTGLVPVPGPHVRPKGVSPAASGPYEITSMVPAANGANGCLDADTNTMGHNGTIVQFWQCTGASNQLWYLVLDGSGVCSGCYLIQNADSGRVLDADSSTLPKNGTKVQLWDWLENDNQYWRP